MIHSEEERLDHYLDQFATFPGYDSAPNGAATVVTISAKELHTLDAGDRSADPRPAFLAQLKEQLQLNASDAVMPFPNVPNALAPSRDRQLVEEASTKGQFTLSLRHPVIGGIATAALLVITLIGAYLAFLTPHRSGNETPTVPAAAPLASPSPQMAGDYECKTDDPFYGCPKALVVVGSNFVQPSNYSGEALDARQVQLQGWEVAPGAIVTTTDLGDAARGVVVDLVVSGIYTGTFDVPVVVSRQDVSGGTYSFEYLNSGASVELGRGDSIAYQLGGLTDLRNSLSIEQLEFKRAVIYEGNINSWIGSIPNGVTTRIEGDATLPQPIGSFTTEAVISLYYVQPYPPNVTFPPRQWADGTFVGSVDFQNGPQGTVGFALVIEPGMG